MLIRLAGRIAVWQVALVTFALAARDGAPLVMAFAITLLGITAIRVRGRWLDRWFFLFLGYRGRTRVHRAATALGVIAPRLDTNEYRDPGGTVTGVLTDGPHWIVVLRLEGSAASAPLVAALRASLDPSGPVRASMVQLVRWAVPRPSDPTKPALAVPAWNVDWIAVRGPASSSPTAAVRLATVLGAQGFSVHPVREPDLPAELASSLGVAQTAGGAVTARENWRSVSLGRLHHATYRLVRPPRDPARLAHALSWLAGPPSLSTCVSLTFSSASSASASSASTSSAASSDDVTVALRVAVPAGRSRREVRGALRAALGQMAPHTRPMNGRHAEGILATLPLAYL